MNDARAIVRILFSPPAPSVPPLSTDDATASSVYHNGIHLAEGGDVIPELVTLRLKVEEMVTRHLRVACSDPPPLPPNPGGDTSGIPSSSGSILSANPALLNSVCLALSLVEEINAANLASSSSSMFEDDVAPWVIKSLVKATKELNAQAQMIVQQVRFRV